MILKKLINLKGPNLAEALLPVQSSVYLEFSCFYLLTDFSGAGRQRHLPLLTVTH